MTFHPSPTATCLHTQQAMLQKKSNEWGRVRLSSCRDRVGNRSRQEATEDENRTRGRCIFQRIPFLPFSRPENRQGYRSVRALAPFRRLYKSIGAARDERCACRKGGFFPYSPSCKLTNKFRVKRRRRRPNTNSRADTRWGNA